MLETSKVIPGDLDSVLKSNMQRRFGDPILGAYSLAFILYNWRIPLIVFSEKTADEKISSIARLLDLSKPEFQGRSDFLQITTDTILHPLIMPGIITISVLFLMPWLLRGAYQRIHRLQVQSANDSFDARQGLSPIKAVIENLRNAHRVEAQRVDDLKSVVSSQEETIRAMKQTNDELERSRNALVKNRDFKISPSNDPIFGEALQALRDNGLLDTFLAFGWRLNHERIEAYSLGPAEQANIRQLTDMGLASNLKDGDYVYFNLTEMGVRMLTFFKAK